MVRARQWAASCSAPWPSPTATGDPLALGDDELADLADTDTWCPASNLHLVSDDHGPARMRLYVAVTIKGHCLDDGALRAGIAEHLVARFKVVDVAVSAGERITGTPA